MNEDTGFVYKDYVTVDGKEHGYFILRNESEIVVRLTDRTIIVEDPKKFNPFILMKEIRLLLVRRILLK